MESRMYFEAVQQVSKTLQAMEGWFEKAGNYAESRGFDAGVFLHARLAPDQFDFTRQIQSACDAAKFLAARTAGKDPPKHPDTEDDGKLLVARIRAVVEYLATFKPEDFEGADARVIPLGWMPGKGMTGRDYLWQLAIPNFYFHATTAYAILRHNGVDLGKVDYLGPIALVDV